VGLTVDVAVAKTNKYASRESGDTAEIVERPGGGLSAVVVDGQGSGKAAKTLSLLLASRAVGLLKDGVRDEAVAMAVHDFLFSYRHGQVSATLDILSFDQAAGSVVLTRNGVAPAVVGVGDRYETVPPEAGSLGLYAATRPAARHFPAEPGLRVIVVTDGVVGSGERSGLGRFDVAAFANERLGGVATAAETAELVLAEAIRRDDGRPRDDVTVAVLSLGSHEDAVLIRRAGTALPLP
jgi:serine phosphatase RsbU (regulator of sigma subunit)